MIKSKYHLLGKKDNGKFTQVLPTNNNDNHSRRVKRQRRQSVGGTNKVWLRSRRRIRRELLGR